jgi:hypothetical protein
VKDELRSFMGSLGRMMELFRLGGPGDEAGGLKVVSLPIDRQQGDMCEDCYNFCTMKIICTRSGSQCHSYVMFGLNCSNLTLLSWHFLVAVF